MSKKPTARFAVIDPVTRRHSGVWRVWASKNDVYLASHSDGGVYKVSLHPTGYRLAFTTEHWKTGAQPNNAPGPGRTIVEYPPSEPVDGVRHAWFMLFQPAALLSTESLAANLTLIEDYTADQVVKIDVWICDHGVSRRPRLAVPPSPLHLADGSHVWVGYEAVNATDADGHDSTRRDYPTAAFMFVDRAEPHHGPGLHLQPADIG